MLKTQITNIVKEKEMKLLYKFQVHMEKKKYHMRIFRHEDLDLVLLTISDHGKF